MVIVSIMVTLYTVLIIVKLLQYCNDTIYSIDGDTIYSIDNGDTNIDTLSTVLIMVTLSTVMVTLYTVLTMVTLLQY